MTNREDRELPEISQVQTVPVRQKQSMQNISHLSTAYPHLIKRQYINGSTSSTLLNVENIL